MAETFIQLSRLIWRGYSIAIHTNMSTELEKA